MISSELVSFLRQEFMLDWHGIHGARHWARVRYNGLVIACRNGANVQVVELFSFLHDARRNNDGSDPLHGERAAELVRELQGKYFNLERAELRLLELACREHTAGQTDADLTVQTCWDADRLDLGRVGIRPDPAYLCTDAAREPATIAAACERSSWSGE